MERDVFVPQAIEDVFFLLLRVVERALATGNEGSAFSVGNYIVELLDPIQESKVFQLISLRRTYRGCHKSQMIVIDNNNNNNDDNDESIVTSCSTNSLTPSTSNNIKGSNSEKRSKGRDSPVPPTPPTSLPTSIPTSLPTSLLSGVAVASFSNVNNWLMSLAESAAPIAPVSTSSNAATVRNESEKSKVSIHSTHG